MHQRYKLGRAIVITSNRVVQDWGKCLGDATMATTILDRLRHRCAMLEFEGKSYRMEEAAARIAVTGNSSEPNRPAMGEFGWPKVGEFDLAIGGGKRPPLRQILRVPCSRETTLFRNHASI